MVRMSLDELHLPCSVRLNGANTQTDLSRNPLSNLHNDHHTTSEIYCIKISLLEMDKIAYKYIYFPKSKQTFH